MDKHDRPVEIMMAVYNGETYLPEQLDSILAQSDEGWHLTVSDDGSTDGSTDILDGYAGKYHDRIARLRSGCRFGNARDHFFYLMSQCDSEYMLFCDQDDVWYADKLLRTREELERAEREYGADTPILVFSDQTPTDAALKPLAHSLMRYQNQYFEHFDYRSILMQNVVTGGATGINRALAKLAARGAGTGGVIMHDWWLAAVAARFGRIIYIDEPLGLYRQHGENAVGAKGVDSAAYIANRLGRLGEVRRSILRKKAQASAFEACYRDRLEAADIEFLERFAKPHSGLGFFLKYHQLIHGRQRLAGMLLMN